MLEGSVSYFKPKEIIFRNTSQLVIRRTFVEEQFIAFENNQPVNIREWIGEGQNNLMGYLETVL